MSEIGDILTDLGSDIMPNEVLSVVLPDLMNIISETNNTDSAGGFIKASTATAYANIPVVYEAQNNENRAIQAGRQLPEVEYKLTCPTYQTDGTRINLSASHRLKVLARDDEPIKWFRIIGTPDIQGVYWEASCVQESNE